MNRRDYDERLLRLKERQEAAFDVLQSIVATQRQIVDDHKTMVEQQRLIVQHQQQASAVLGGVIPLLTQIRAGIGRIEPKLP